MVDRTEEPRSSVTRRDVYQVLTSLVIHSEQVRWGRLSTFLVMSSVFVLAWVGVLTGMNAFPGKRLLLLVLCIPGILLGALWARLGWRSSEYMDDFHDKAFEMEKQFPPGVPKPFHLSEDRRKNVRGSMERFTSSKWLIAAMPVIFSILFFALAVLSFVLKPEGRGMRTTHRSRTSRLTSPTSAGQLDVVC